ncbi:uncharacterized protein MONBRDRAFT_22428 [Monosiga brevicollis MX1]|uniref:Uncharacterized protein n=1 Tax=Monosiga brevicollis TaxID=81824 RepID=A9UQJ6_MONBE|nr:uncharacterized protein MONBRDRAFT_22428 [Monosiga brevicollis MX1]EDQ92610.1 predicted protein [Monosiga brevicollis MX1]|eukprot:XP_001742372.1 hypothetical protein [Monosiga brevicollis MX1]
MEDLIQSLQSWLRVVSKGEVEHLSDLCDGRNLLSWSTAIVGAEPVTAEGETAFGVVIEQLSDFLQLQNLVDHVSVSAAVQGNEFELCKILIVLVCAATDPFAMTDDFAMATAELEDHECNCIDNFRSQLESSLRPPQQGETAHNDVEPCEADKAELPMPASPEAATHSELKTEDAHATESIAFCLDSSVIGTSDGRLGLDATPHSLQRKLAAISPGSDRSTVPRGFHTPLRESLALRNIRKNLADGQAFSPDNRRQSMYAESNSIKLLQNQLEHAYAEHDGMCSELANRNVEIQQLREQLKDKQELEEQVMLLQDQLDTLRTQSSRDERLRTELQTLRDRTTDLQDANSALLQERDSLRNHVDKLQSVENSCRDWENRHKEQRAKVTQLQVDKAELHAQLEAKRHQLEAAANRQQQDSATVEKLRGEISALKGELQASKFVQHEQPNWSERQQLEGQLEALQKANASLQADLEAASVRPSQMAQVEEELLDAVSLNRALEESVAARETKIAEMEVTMDELRNQLSIAQDCLQDEQQRHELTQLKLTETQTDLQAAQRATTREKQARDAFEHELLLKNRAIKDLTDDLQQAHAQRQKLRTQLEQATANADRVADVRALQQRLEDAHATHRAQMEKKEREIKALHNSLLQFQIQLKRIQESRNASRAASPKAAPVSAQQQSSPLHRSESPAPVSTVDSKARASVANTTSAVGQAFATCASPALASPRVLPPNPTASRKTWGASKPTTQVAPDTAGRDHYRRTDAERLQELETRNLKQKPHLRSSHFLETTQFFSPDKRCRSLKNAVAAEEAFSASQRGLPKPLALNMTLDAAPLISEPATQPEAPMTSVPVPKAEAFEIKFDDDSEAKTKPKPKIGTSGDAPEVVARCAAALDVVSEAVQGSGFEVQTRRIAFGDPQAWLDWSDEGRLLAQLGVLDRALVAHDIQFCSLGCLMHASAQMVQLVPAVLGFSPRFNLSLDLPPTDHALATAVAHVVMELAQHDVMSNFRFCTTACCDVGLPFFPGASAPTNVALGYVTIALGLENGDLLQTTLRSAQKLSGISKAMREVFLPPLKQLEAAAQAAASRAGVQYAGIDTSLNPSLDPGLSGSVAAAFENLIEVPRFGGAGTLAAVAEVTRSVQALPVQQTGYRGLMLPLCEDRQLAQLATAGQLCVQQLLMFSAVCGVGIDTVPIPSDTSITELASLYLDVSALAHRWTKPLSCRVFPVPGSTAGQMTTFDSPYLVNASILALS